MTKSKATITDQSPNIELVLYNGTESTNWSMSMILLLSLFCNVDWRCRLDLLPVHCQK